MVKIKGWDEQAVSSFEVYRFFYGPVKVWELLDIRVEKVDGGDVNLLLGAVFWFVVRCSLESFAGIDFLIVDKRNQNDVNAPFNRAEHLLLFLIVWLIDIMRPLVKMNSLELRNIVIETWKHDISNNFIRYSSVSDIFNSYGSRYFLFCKRF